LFSGLELLKFMNDDYSIRLGSREDIYQIASVYADSIQELCKNDYEPEIIASWAYSTPPESRFEAIDRGLLWVAVFDGI